MASISIYRNFKDLKASVHGYFLTKKTYMQKSHEVSDKLVEVKGTELKGGIKLKLTKVLV
jgi:hypothetical protein